MENLVSIIIPAYNEANYIKQTVDELRNFFKGPRFEIIVSADGCTDLTSNVVRRISKIDKRVKAIGTVKRLGKGGGLKNGFYASQGDIVVFADADQSSSPSEIARLIELLKGFDIVIGSRAIDRTKVLKRQSLVRDYMGRIFNSLLRIIIGIKIKDTQCGYKAFRRNALTELIPKVKSNGWEFDAELLYRATKDNYKIYECAIQWRNRSESKLSIFPDSLEMLIGLIKMRLTS